MFRVNKSVILAILAVGLVPGIVCSASSTRRGPATFGLGERALDSWIDKGDYKTASAALGMHANPNAVNEEGRTLFAKAFDKALKKDENNHVQAVDGERAKIVLEMAQYGGNLKDIEREIAQYYKPGMFDSRSISTLAGIKESMFADQTAAVEFKKLVEDMKKAAKAGPKKEGLFR